MPRDCPEDIVDLIHECTQQNPTLRPDMKQCFDRIKVRHTGEVGGPVMLQYLEVGIRGNRGPVMLQYHEIGVSTLCFHSYRRQHRPPSFRSRQHAEAHACRMLRVVLHSAPST